MRAILIICFLFCFSINSFEQESHKHKINFIILVDGKIPAQGDINLHIVLNHKNGSSDTYSVDYVPGDIELEQSVFDNLLSTDIQLLRLDVKYSKLEAKEVHSYSYKIDFNRNWLHQTFTILRVYNLNKKENKKIYFPLAGLNYTYEIDSPNGSMLRVRKN